MLYHMPALVRRGSVYIYRREVPPKLRALIGKREIKESLKTTDERVAQRRWRVVHERVSQRFAEAEKGAVTHRIAAYRAVRDWRKSDDPRSEDALDWHIEDMLEERTDL